jgi:hypothetical protein
MSDSSKLMQWLEQHLKEQHAEITLLRLIMQEFLRRAIPSVGTEEHLQDLKNEVMGSLGRDQGAAEMAALTETRAEQFFRELEGMMATARGRRPVARQLVVVSPYLRQF